MGARRPHESRRGEVRVRDARARTTTPAPRRVRKTPPLPGFLAAAGLIGLAVVALGTVGGGDPVAEAPARPAVVGEADDFDEYLASPTTLAATTTTGAQASEEAVLAVDQRRAENLAKAHQFYAFIGDGFGDNAAAMVEPAFSEPLGNLARFFAEFRSGLRATTCDTYASNAVSCLVLTTDPMLEHIGIGSVRQRLILAFGPEGGVASFSVPAAFGSATSRLSLFAQQEMPELFSTTCDWSIESAAVLPTPVGFAATAECGQVLSGLVPAYLEAGS